MLIFGSSPGVVGAVVTGQALPFAVSMGGNTGVPRFPGFKLAKAVVTGFDVGQQSGLGVTHTLRDRIYVYVYGERAGMATVSGLAFAGACGTSGNYTGFDAVYSYYERVRASTQGLPVKLIFGPNTTLAGFLTDMNYRLEDPDTGVGSFAFKFVTMPRNSGNFGYLPPPTWESNPGPPFDDFDNENQGGAGGDF